MAVSHCCFLPHAQPSKGLAQTSIEMVNQLNTTGPLPQPLSQPFDFAQDKLGRGESRQRRDEGCLPRAFCQTGLFPVHDSRATRYAQFRASRKPPRGRPATRSGYGYKNDGVKIKSNAVEGKVAGSCSNGFHAQSGVGFPSVNPTYRLVEPK
jgi:hypothetical protein